MRIVLTKYHEEATIIRKSVKQVRVEAGRRSTRNAGSSVIELNPELTTGDKTLHAHAPYRFKIQHNEAIPALSAHVGEVTDTVALHAPSKNDNVRRPIDAFAGDSRSAHLGDDHGDQKTLPASIPNPSRIPWEYTGDNLCHMNGRMSSRYDLPVRRYIAMQEVTKTENWAEKGLIIEIEV